MSIKFTKTILTCFLLTFLFFQPVQASTKSAEDSYRSVLIELIEMLQKQIKTLQAELVKKQNELSTPENTSLFVSTTDIVNVYKVNHSSDVKYIENTAHQKYFQRVFKIFPEKFDSKIGRLMVFDGSDAGHVAFVETIPPNHDKWVYAISDSILKDVNSDKNTELIVHELAHIVSYEQIPSLAKRSGHICHSYFKSYGCPESNSYLSKFVDKFWSTEDLNRIEAFKKTKNTNKFVTDFYLNNSTGYVSEYASLNPEEDFAETFMFFVLDSAVTGNRISEKIEFMESYPELRSLKEEIIKNK